MKPGGGKSKGTGFERQIAKKLSLWYTEGERDDVVWRTSISGGRATVRSQQGKSTAGQHGDLTYTDPCIKPLFDRVVIECKTGYGKWGVLDLIDSSSSSARCVIETWLDKGEEDRKEAGADYLWLIAKRDRRVPIIIVPHRCIMSLRTHYGREHSQKLRFVCLGIRWALPLDRFLRWCSPAYFKDGRE